MFVNELFENKDLGQEAKELIAMVDNPNAIKAMISPHIKPFKARTIKVSINYFFSTLIGCVLNLLILKSKISNLL